MTRVAETTRSEADAADEAALALGPEALQAGVLPLPDEDFPGALADPMGRAAFSAYLDEVAVVVSVALDYLGMEEQFDTVVKPFSADPELGDLHQTEDAERVVGFVDAEGSDLPVYVSCGSNGIIFVVVGRTGPDGEEDAVFVSPPRTLAEADALLADVVQAMEREIPRPTLH